MRRIASVACAAMTLVASGCVVGRAPVATSSASQMLPVAAAYGPSRGTPAFGNYVRAREPQLQFCYQESRVQNPNLVGSATVAVDVAPDGSVTNANILRSSWSERGSESIEQCVLSRVRSWKFPTSDPAEQHLHSFAVIFSR